jgi:hypothetical protein
VKNNGWRNTSGEQKNPLAEKPNPTNKIQTKVYMKRKKIKKKIKKTITKMKTKKQ